MNPRRSVTVIGAGIAGMATAEKVEVTADALRALHAPVFDAYEPLVRHAGVEDLMARSGQLYVYETEQGLEGDRVGWDMRRARGVEVQELDADAIRQLEPALAPIYQCGVYLPEHGFCRNPGRLVQALAERGCYRISDTECSRALRAMGRANGWGIVPPFRVDRF